MVEPQPAPQVSYNIGDAVSYGWTGFWANIGPLAVVAVVVFFVNLVFNMIGNATDSWALFVLVRIIGNIVSILIGLGWIRAGLAITAGQRPELDQIFRIDETVLVYLGATILYWIAVTIGLILLIVPGIIFVLVFGFYGWTIADRQLGVVDSFARSAEITRGHRLELFGLGIVLILMNIVGLLCLIIGVLFTMGISLVALAYTYRVLSGEPVAPAGSDGNVGPPGAV